MTARDIDTNNSFEFKQEEQKNIKNEEKIGGFKRFSIELLAGQVDCPGALKIGWGRVDWRMLIGRSVFHRTRRDWRSYKSNLCLKYADHWWTGIRCIVHLIIIILYMRRELTITPFSQRFEFLTSMVALLSLIYCVLTLILQLISFYTLKKDQLLYSNITWRHEDVILSDGIGWTQTKWMRGFANIKQVMSIMMVPLNIIVIMVYWMIIYPSERDEDGKLYPVDLNNVISHALGGSVIIIDWCLENSWFFILNGWPLALSGLYYSIFLICWRVFKGIAIYPSIDPMSMEGFIFILLLNLVALPMMLILMTLIKSYKTVMLQRQCTIAMNSIEKHIPISTLENLNTIPYQ